MDTKMYICYGVGGHNQTVYSNPHVGIAEPDEIEVRLAKDVTIGELESGSRCLFYKGSMPYPDNSLSFVNNNIISHEYNSGDDSGRPTGSMIVLGTIKK